MDRSSIFVLSLVAVVAVIGLITLSIGPDTGSVFDENIVGEAFSKEFEKSVTTDVYAAELKEKQEYADYKLDPINYEKEPIDEPSKDEPVPAEEERERTTIPVERFETAPACKDSDNGENHAVRGTVYGLELPGIWDTWTDYCGTVGVEKGKLVEYVCRSDDYGAKVLVDCPNGCFEGTCVSAPTCTDTDEGIVSTVGGAVSVDGITTYDTCDTSRNFVIEAYCDWSDRLQTAPKDCDELGLVCRTSVGGDYCDDAEEERYVIGFPAGGSGAPEVPGIAPTCRDTDDGDEPYIPGTLVDHTGSMEDSCYLDSNRLTEYYCAPEGAQARQVYCDKLGMVCLTNAGGEGYCGEEVRDRPTIPVAACTPTESPYTMCADGVDNDCDGLIDCADSDCLMETGLACLDGVDNDGDGAIDCADSDCSYMSACGGPGYTDFVPSCTLIAVACVPSGAENTAATCTDKRDNDCDGLIDCLDDSCSVTFECAVAPAPDPTTVEPTPIAVTCTDFDATSADPWVVPSSAMDGTGTHKDYCSSRAPSTHEPHASSDHDLHEMVCDDGVALVSEVNCRRELGAGYVCVTHPTKIKGYCDLPGAGVSPDPGVTRADGRTSTGVGTGSYTPPASEGESKSAAPLTVVKRIVRWFTFWR